MSHGEIEEGQEQEEGQQGQGPQQWNLSDFPMAATRSTEDREKHLRVMEKSLLEGGIYGEVVQASAAKYGISQRQAKADITEIYRRWEKASKEIAQRKHTQCSLMRALARRELIIARAFKEGDLRMALEAEKDRCELVGLYADPIDDDIDRMLGTGQLAQVEPSEKALPSEEAP